MLVGLSVGIVVLLGLVVVLGVGYLDKIRRFSTLREECEQLKLDKAKLGGDVREKQIRLEAEGEKVLALKQQFEEQKEALKVEFKSVSEEILKKRQESLTEQNEQNKLGVAEMLKPLQEQIKAFQHRVNEVHDQTLEGNVDLKKELEKLMEEGLKMRDEASHLTTALKGDSQQRGAWGEAQLERTLEMSGLVKDDHYQKQKQFRDGDGGKKQLDFLIKVPGDKDLIIDSKVSLNAYEKACSVENVDLQQATMQEHVKAVKTHINELAKKDYTHLIGLRTPGFVLMFMPIESAYIDAMKHDKTLYEYGFERNIVLVSHTTLIPVLRTVASLWALEQSNREARENGNRAGEIYNSVCRVVEKLKRLGNTLHTVSTHYNETVTAIAGKQGLIGKTERFKRLSSKATKEMPSLEERHLEFDGDNLEIEPLTISPEE